MARTVTDAAILLGALEGAAPDANDPATKTCAPPPGRDYTKFLETGALKGARIGIPRAFFYDKLTPPGGKEPRGGVNADQAKVMADAIAVAEDAGRRPRRSRRHPEHRGQGREEQLPDVEHLFGLERQEGQGRGLLGLLQVRHEARFQQVAGVARPVGAGQDVDGTARSGT